MKRILSTILFAALLLSLLAACAPAATPAPTDIPTPVPPTATPVPATSTPSPADALAKLHWFGTSAFLYNGSKVVYFDPVTLTGTLPKADLILITHAHTDHYSVTDLQQIIGPNTTLVIGTNVTTAYEADKDTLGIEATIMNAGDKKDFGGVTVEAVPAYDTTFHPQTANGVGYLVSLDGLTLYTAGGTAAYPEMANYAADIAFVPVYSKANAQAIVEALPAKTFIFAHTSYYAAAAVANLFNPEYGPAKQFVALEAGANNP
jgi:L-ascorbate metabolism protein UlaG (beta-lactamase superfamily)